jgi:hypothetical protein
MEIKFLSNQKMSATVAYKNALAELLQHVRFEARYEGLVTLGLESLRSVLEPISRPVITNMARNGMCVDESSLRAAGFNAYDWEIALGKLEVPIARVSPVAPQEAFLPVEETPVATADLDLEPPVMVQPVRGGARKSKKVSASD